MIEIKIHEIEEEGTYEVSIVKDAEHDESMCFTFSTKFAAKEFARGANAFFNQQWSFTKEKELIVVDQPWR